MMSGMRTIGVSQRQSNSQQKKRNSLGVFDPALHLRHWAQLIHDIICCQEGRVGLGQGNLLWCSWCHEGAVQRRQVLF
jgi:hypothetical protein